MDKKSQMGVNPSSSSSLTMDLFGPKHSSSSSSGYFGTVFGLPSTAMRRDSSHAGTMRNKDFGNENGSGKHGVSGNTQNKSEDPCYFSSSIYYEGQEVYSPTAHTATPQHNFKKDGGEYDANRSNSSSASRGNWWQGWKCYDSVDIYGTRC